MLEKHALWIGVLGLALCACGDDDKRPSVPDAPTPEVDAAIPAPPPMDAPETDAFVPQDAPVPPIVNLAPNPGLEEAAAGTDGWTTNGGSAVVFRSTEQPHGGAASLLVMTRQGNWNGPAVDITSKVAQGKEYAASVFVRLREPGSATFLLSTRPVCQEHVDPLFNDMTNHTRGTATDNQTWVPLSSTFTVRPPVLDPPDPNVPVCTIIDFKVYVETDSGMADFYVDDISITEVTR